MAAGVTDRLWSISGLVDPWGAEEVKEQRRVSVAETPKFFRSASDLRSWLASHHDKSDELIVGFYRKGSNEGLTYPEALDEALCFGWIDGLRKKCDEDSYIIRFTPRRPGSVWSKVNIKRVCDLMAAGLMKPAGLRAFNARDEQDTRRNAAARQVGQLAPGFQSIFRANNKAWTFFNAQPPGYRKLVIAWVMSAKKGETRTRRLAHVIERSANGHRLDLLNPNRK